MDEREGWSVAARAGRQGDRLKYIPHPYERPRPLPIFSTFLLIVAAFITGAALFVINP